MLGPEAPLIALGSAVGLAITHFVDMDPAHHSILAMVGAFSAISALFGSPLAAGILLIEAGIGLGKLLIPLIVLGLVAAAIGYLLFTGFGNWGGLDETDLSVPGLPPYESVELGDLVVAVVAGVLIALGVVAALGLARRVVVGGGARGSGSCSWRAASRRPDRLAADALGADSQDVLFSGQASLPALVAEHAAAILAGVAAWVTVMALERAPRPRAAG